MSMTLKHVGSICSFQILENFPFDYRYSLEDAQKKVKEYVVGELLKRSFSFAEYGIICAITNGKQRIAAQVLRQLGFRQTAWYTSGIHPNTPIKLHYIHGKKLQKIVDNLKTKSKDAKAKEKDDATS